MLATLRSTSGTAYSTTTTALSHDHWYRSGHRGSSARDALRIERRHRSGRDSDATGSSSDRRLRFNRWQRCDEQLRHRPVQGPDRASHQTLNNVGTLQRQRSIVVILQRHVPRRSPRPPTGSTPTAPKPAPPRWPPRTPPRPSTRPAGTSTCRSGPGCSPPTPPPSRPPTTGSCNGRRNTSGTWTDVVAATGIADSYPSSNVNAGGGGGLFDTTTAQPNRSSVTGRTLSGAGFYLVRGHHPGRGRQSPPCAPTPARSAPPAPPPGSPWRPRRPTSQPHRSTQRPHLGLLRLRPDVHADRRNALLHCHHLHHHHRRPRLGDGRR